MLPPRGAHTSLGGPIESSFATVPFTPPPPIVRLQSYFITLIAVVEMMPRQFSRFTGFLGSKVNYIMWWCFLKAMWKAVRGRLGFKKIVFKVTEKKGDGTAKKEPEKEKKDLLSSEKNAG